MESTLERMAANTDKHKPSRMVRIPEAIAVALENMASKQFNSLTEQVKIACREYLEKHDQLPDPSGPTPKKKRPPA